VTGPPDAVFAALRTRLDGGDAHFAADPDARLIVQQGDWWYRGEYRVLPDPGGTDGSRVEYEIVNVAPKAHWMGPIAGRDVLRASPAAFAALLGELEDDTGSGAT
jgi:hypothetical protein